MTNNVPLSLTQRQMIYDLAMEKIAIHEAEITTLQPMLQEAKIGKGFDDTEQAIRFAAKQEATIIIAKGEIAVYKRLINAVSGDKVEEAK